MKCTFFQDHIQTAAQAHAAAAAAIAWRRQYFPQPHQRPAPALLAPRTRMMVPDESIKVDFGRARIRDVIEIALTVFGISRHDLLGHCRKGYLIVPRQAAMIVAHQLCGQSGAQVAKAFRRDHTTLIHAQKKYSAAKHPKLQATVDQLIAAIKAGGTSDD